MTLEYDFKKQKSELEAIDIEIDLVKEFFHERQENGDINEPQN